ncbi:MAG: DUF1080 domain-containing protein [Gemmataceae bacterium]|nr:DUF1080 domain-containing protein [Gemmataceae bacterium]
MQRWLGWYLATLPVVLIVAPLAHPAGGESAFIDKSLNGWEGLIEKYWRWDTEHNALVGSTKPDGLKFNTFLCSKRQYADFELSFQVKMTKGGNSGIQIRSHVHDKTKFAVTGPQCDIGQQYWGSLYGENFGGMMKAAPADLVKKIVKEDDWNHYYIRAEGKHITIKINDTVTVDGDFPKAPAAGIIAFQLHSGGPMEVVFKNIQFKELKR